MTSPAPSAKAASQEDGQGRVADHPEDLRGEQRPHSWTDHCGRVEPKRPVLRLFRFTGVGHRQMPDGRPREQEHADGRKDERSPQGQLREKAPEGEPGQPADQRGDLQGPVALRIVLGLEAVVDEGPMGRHHDVHAHVRKGARQREHQERRALAERDGAQPARREQAAHDDERPSPVPRRVTPIAPAADEERHRKAGRRVDHHHQPDQGRRLPDVREQEREIGRRHRAHETRSDSGRGEDDQVGEAAPRTERQRENARQPSLEKWVARDRMLP
jgi:hypothetical protein